MYYIHSQKGKIFSVVHELTDRIVGKSMVNPVTTENLETSNLQDVQQHTAFLYGSQYEILSKPILAR